ncbi:bifunctional serine/threonine-protein kinase/glutamate ABC transporter substrate-binding protein [Streptomyces sp. NBC_01255]|uniref:bifunctional serine/threonine-protein kinase/glutamate ABC transporter substrate-binding protein n=1 Tax=Streptomyces sp. NBC_01255 TaxID=2903798 RepID=UPI002E303859|nr:bifunctional serine/threonine-protein kinase/glutamate ABC transporter substrate-binding protein [Streptomyces sp. NBC_01255]
MGTVWRARDTALHREVALKEVRPPDPALAEYDPEGARALRTRVLREARALARIAHPHVVTIHHIVDGGEDTYPWLVMELVTGGSLHDRLDRGPLSPAETAALGRGVLSGLRAAHAAGIQHRDIKPANVLLRPDGRPVLTDFGIAAVHGATALTAAGSIIGTPDYMAPERVGGEEGGPAADLWSLAMMLYVAVEGHHPLRRANTLATLAAVLGEDVPPPRNAGALTRVLTDVLVRDPAARPDAETLDRLLAEAEAETPASAPAASGSPTSYPLAPPLPATPPGKPGKRRGPVYAGAVTAVALCGVLVWSLLPDGDGDGGDDGKKVSGAPSSVAPSTSTSAPAGGSGGSGITIGIKFDQPGLGWKNPDGTFSGFDVEVAAYVARALGHDLADVTWKEARSATRESLLTGGEVDLVVATYTVNDQRKQRVDFVGPYLVAHQDVLLRAADTGVTRPADLNGRKVCSAVGSTSALNVRTLAPQAQLREYDGYARCVDDLASGAVDAVTTDDSLLAGYAAQAAFKGRFRLAGFRTTDEPYGIGLPKGSPLTSKVRSALEQMVSDGSWQAAVQRNLPLLRADAPPLR